MVTKCSGMGLDLELKERVSGEMEVRVDEENGNVLTGAVDALAPCSCNYEDKSFAAETLNQEQANRLDQQEDVVVDIIDCSTTFDKGQEEVLGEDTIESVSSFGDTDVVSEREKDSGNAEVVSKSCINPAQTSPFDGGGIPFRSRNKRLTDHWRRFIHPIMWRCKWIELQLKTIHNQALKYDQELAENEQRKQFECGTFLVEDFHAKSLPFSRCAEGQKVQKRKKRKRLEETTDVGSYMAQHNLFSYYEFKNGTAGGNSLDDNCIRRVHIADGKTKSNQESGHQDGWVYLESNDGDEFFAQIIRSIEMLQMQVRKLRTRSDTVVNQIPKKFSSINMLSLSAPSNALNNSETNHASPPENRASSVMPLTNILESIGLPQDGDSCENSEEQVLIHNQTAKEEMQDFSTFGCHLKDHQKMIDQKMLQGSDADLSMDTIVTRVRYGGKSLPKSRSIIPVTKRR